MLFDRIKADPILSPFIRPVCEDFGMSAVMESAIKPTDYLIIKVDDYYNSLNIARRPAAPDCLIIQQCQNGGYAASIVELKNIASGKGYTIQNVVEKFETCLSDFMSIRFKEYFFQDYKRLKLYFVTNMNTYKRDADVMMGALSSKRYMFRGKKYLIDPRMPLSQIKPCY